MIATGFGVIVVAIIANTPQLWADPPLRQTIDVDAQMSIVVSLVFPFVETISMLKHGHIGSDLDLDSMACVGRRAVLLSRCIFGRVASFTSVSAVALVRTPFFILMRTPYHSTVAAAPADRSAKRGKDNFRFRLFDNRTP